MTAYIRRQYSGHSSYSDALLSGITAGSTAITLKDGTTFPDGSVGPFVVTIDAGTATEEKVLVTTRSGANLQNCTRGYDGTTAGAHSANAGVFHTISAVDADEANQVAHQLLGGSSTAGQMPYVTGAGTYAFLPAPTTGQLLGYSAGVPGWIANGTYVPWFNGVAGELPATSGQHLTTQGGGTLDDGSGNVTLAGSVSLSVAAPFIQSTTSASALTINAGPTSYLTVQANGVNVAQFGQYSPAGASLALFNPPGTTWLLTGYSTANSTTRVFSVDTSGNMVSAGTVTAQELITRTDKTSGALSTTASWLSGTGQQIDNAHDRFLSFSLVTTSAAGTCTVALSPDNVTYSNVATITPAITAATIPFGLYVPKGWYVKLTFSNGTVAAGTFW